MKGLHLSDVVQLTEFQSCQIEEPLQEGAITSRRFLRSVEGADEGKGEDSLKSRKKRSPAAAMVAHAGDETGPTAYYRPTYIYGLPMFDYLRRRSDEEEEPYQSPDVPSGSFPSDQTNPSRPQEVPQRTEIPSTIPDLGSLENPWDNEGKEDLLQLQAEALLRHDLLDPSYYASFPAPHDENRVNRMGVPHGRMPDNGDNYYRQNNVGTLAFDRAFLYAVRHNPTGLLLFMGRYLDPAAN